MTTTADQITAATGDTTLPASAPSRPSRTSPAGGPRIDVTALHQALLGRWPTWRAKARAHAAEPRFWKDDSLPMAEHRERVLGQVKMLAADPEHQVWLAYPKRLGGQDSPGANLAGFEELAIGDPSLQIKAGVQFGLFGSAIWQLGTPEQQDRWLPGAMDVSVPGAFAMTEKGHGSDVASLATTATYDAEAGEFVINTPFRGAWKDFLGNAAKDGLAATVFARLITRGPGETQDTDYGVHCFYVPIRDEAGEFLPGVGGEDDGLKGGLNGIDNGSLWFDHVRVPRENLLARYGQVAADGTYTSPIASPGRRFFTMLGALVQGRVSLDGAAGSATRIGLAIAVRYAEQRRQFAGAAPDEEVTLLDYATHRRRLIPLVAETYALHYAHERLLDMFDDVFSGRNDTEQTRADLETMAAAMKGTSTTFALEALQECRVACGGAGFITENRIVSLRADMDVYATFEGDNTILLQLVAKRLVGDYGKDLGRQVKTAQGKARYVAGRAADVALHRFPLRRAAQAVADVTRPDSGAVFDVALQRALLTERVAAKVEALALGLRPAQKADPAEAQRIFDRHQVALIDVARSHAELVRWDLFTEAVASTKDAGTAVVLGWLRDEYALTVIRRDLGWFVANGRLTGSRARALDGELDALERRLRPHLLDLVDAWGLGDDHLRAVIATGVEQERQDEARAYYAAQRAAGTLPTKEKRGR